ncbi:MAG: patatin-like phospholipase family protein [Clostridia bacterium]|nr:patatin-like phospholipase family protein [Clostridia bacterium]
MKIGLALAGGGLKCVAYLGALQALEELNIKIDYISGTSSGSIVAVMHALGFKSLEMKELLLENYKDLIKISKIPIVFEGARFFTKNEIKLQGLIDGIKLENKVDKIANEKRITNINQINIPFAVATVDLVSTKECILMSKDYNLKNDDIDYITDISIGKAIRASMAFPGIFTPCEYKNYMFVDGGTKDNLPVKVLKDMGADKVLSLNFRLDDYNSKEQNVMDILLRTVDIFSLKDVIQAQKQADCSIEIDAKEASLLSFDNIEYSIKNGYDTIMQNKEKILKLL